MKRIVFLSFSFIFIFSSCNSLCPKIKKPNNIKPIDWENYNGVYDVYWTFYNYYHDVEIWQYEDMIKICGLIRYDESDPYNFWLVEQSNPKINIPIIAYFEDDEDTEKLKLLLLDNSLEKKCSIQGKLIMDCLYTNTGCQDAYPIVSLQSINDIYFE